MSKDKTKETKTKSLKKTKKPNEKNETSVKESKPKAKETKKQRNERIQNAINIAEASSENLKRLNANLTTLEIKEDILKAAKSLMNKTDLIEKTIKNTNDMQFLMFVLNNTPLFTDKESNEVLHKLSYLIDSENILPHVVYEKLAKELLIKSKLSKELIRMLESLNGENQILGIRIFTEFDIILDQDQCCIVDEFNSNQLHLVNNCLSSLRFKNDVQALLHAVKLTENTDLEYTTNSIFEILKGLSSLSTQQLKKIEKIENFKEFLIEMITLKYKVHLDDKFLNLNDMTLIEIYYLYETNGEDISKILSTFCCLGCITVAVETLYQIRNDRQSLEDFRTHSNNCKELRNWIFRRSSSKIRNYLIQKYFDLKYGFTEDLIGNILIDLYSFHLDKEKMNIYLDFINKFSEDIPNLKRSEIHRNALEIYLSDSEISREVLSSANSISIFYLALKELRK